MASHISFFFLTLASCLFSGQAKIEKIDIIETQFWSGGVDHFALQPFGNMTSEDEVCFLLIPVVYLDKDGQPADYKSSPNIMTLKTCSPTAAGNLKCAFEVKMKLAGWYTCRGTLATRGPETWVFINVSAPVEADHWYENMWGMTTLIAIAACNSFFVISFTGGQAIKRKYIVKNMNAKRGYRRQIFLRSRTLDDPGLGQ